MSKSPPSRAALRVADLPQNGPTAFDVRPDAEMLTALAASLELSGLRKVRFAGEIRGQGTNDWLLTGMLGATVVQPCAVTLAPVTTRIDEAVRRLYVHDYVDVDAPEVEMPEDDEIEPLGKWIDPEAILIEALSLALPMFPRAPGVELSDVSATEPGVAPLKDADMKPFAGLAALKDRMKGDDDT